MTNSRAFKSQFFPLGNQASISVLLLKQIVVEFPRNLLLIVEEVVDISGALMMNLGYLPIVFYFPLGVHGRMLCVLHL